MGFIIIFQHHFGEFIVMFFQAPFTNKSKWLLWLGRVFKYFFYFHPCLGKIPILTNMFQRGWNHQLDEIDEVGLVIFFGDVEKGVNAQLQLIMGVPVKTCPSARVKV